MTLTINLPKELEEQLKREADARHVPIETIALDLLEEALYPTPEQVVEKIRKLPRDPQYVQLPTASVAAVLRDAPPEPTDFDLDQWNKEWTAIEAELKRITHENDLAEGRR